MKPIRFEVIALSMMVGWIATAAGTLTALTGMPVIPADAPVVVVSEVVVPQAHASLGTKHVTMAMLVDGR